MRIVETARFFVREITVEDADFVLRLVNEPSFVANIGDKSVRNLDDARRFILEGTWTNQERPGYGQFLIELKDGGDRVGVCGLLYRRSLDVSDIGFALLPEYWGRGLAYEAATELLEYGHSTLGIETIVGLTSHDNLPSIKVLKKLGMNFERDVKMSEDDPGTALFS